MYKSLCICDCTKRCPFYYNVDSRKGNSIFCCCYFSSNRSFLRPVNADVNKAQEAC